MKNVMIAAMPGDAAPARRLASASGATCVTIDIHHFPDDESRVRAPAAAKTTILYCTLDHPNAKLVELALAASALRDLGAERLILVAPYMCYMRQDAAFASGEAVSQRVIAKLLAAFFDRIVTLEPHLHRVRSLTEIFPDTEILNLSAAPLLARLIKSDGDATGAFIVGPDRESKNWAKAVADEVGAPYAVLEKTRSADRIVSVKMNGDRRINAARVYLVDDVASTGETLAAAARLLHANGAKTIEAVIVHALFDAGALARMRRTGIARIRSTDSVPHTTNAVEIAPWLASALSEEFA